MPPFSIQRYRATREIGVIGRTDSRTDNPKTSCLCRLLLKCLNILRGLLVSFVIFLCSMSGETVSGGSWVYILRGGGSGVAIIAGGHRPNIATVNYP